MACGNEFVEEGLRSFVAHSRVQLLSARSVDFALSLGIAFIVSERKKRPPRIERPGKCTMKAWRKREGIALCRGHARHASRQRGATRERQSTEPAVGHSLVMRSLPRAQVFRVAEKAAVRPVLNFAFGSIVIISQLFV